MGCESMFENIEELVNLFGDGDVAKIILSSYFMSQERNKKLSDAVFQKLQLLKMMYPNINIKINKNSNSPSNYNYIDNIIYLNGIFDESTFFHELTHLFSRLYFNFDIPKEYKDFQNKFLSSKNNLSLLVSFINLCKQEKERILKNTYSLESNDNINNNKPITPLPNNLIELSIISKLEDIVDAITRGKSHDIGLHYEIDDNHTFRKTTKSAGHGCEYFDIPGREFEEIIANYQTINIIDPDNALFNILKTILGSEFINFLDNRCQLMNGCKIILENNNNFHKK